MNNKLSALLKSLREIKLPNLRQASLHIPWKTILEILIILVWAVFVGRHYLDMNPYQYPLGFDFPLQIYNHYIWNDLSECGTCIFWNGSMNGGTPAFADLQSATLHPLVIFATLVWGVVNGAKLLFVFTLIMFGLGIWWLGWVLGLKRPIRVWAALLMVVAGSIASRVEWGMLNIIFSGANAVLILPPLVELYLKRTRRSIVLLGITFALTMLSGQAYIQIAVIFGILPASLILFLKNPGGSRPVWQDFALALAIGILLSAIFWVPTLHFGNNLEKDAIPEFSQTHSLGYLLLDLVLPYELPVDHAWPFGFRQYLGWVPILFAVLGLRLIPREKNRLHAFFWTAIILIFLMTSRDVLLYIAKFYPEVAILRFPINILTVATPLIIGLAAWSIDHLKVQIPIGFTFHFIKWNVRAPITELVLGLILLLTVLDNYGTNASFLVMHPIEPSKDIIAELRTSEAQWVKVPQTNWILATRLLENGYKHSGIYRPSRWKGRSLPPVYLEATDNQDYSNSPDKVGRVGNLIILKHPFAQYAAVLYPDGNITPCQASATGGFIDVTCALERDGVLRVYENNWEGWTATIDNAPASLQDSQWLVTEVPAGTHVIKFRYQPWDVWVGLAISLLGVVLAVWVAIRKQKEIPSLVEETSSISQSEETK